MVVDPSRRWQGGRVAAFFAAELAADRRARGIRAATDSTTGAVRWLDERFDPLPWQHELSEVCGALAESAIARTGKRSTLSAPPRHGKTQYVGLGLPVTLALRCWQRAEPIDVLYATASETLAKKVSRKVRAAIERLHVETGDPYFAPAKGGPWEMCVFATAGGFSWNGLGATSRTGGIPAHLLIMDDLIGSGKAYKSPATRAEILRAVEEDLLSRLEGGAAIQMETRRGIMDTTGYLEREFPGVWESHVWRCFDPARAGDPYLWPARFGAEWRRSMPHLTDSSPLWRSLYQQEPVPEGGTHVPPEWLAGTYSEPVEAVLALADRVVIGCDLANTGKTTSDHCAFVVVAVRGAFRDVLEVRRVRAGFVEQKRILRDLVAAYSPSVVLVERASNGDAIIDELAGEVPGLRGESPAGRDKLARLTPWLPTMAARQVRFPATSTRWAVGLRQELEAFTGIDGEPDDQVDALVWALVAAADMATSRDAYVNADW